MFGASEIHRLIISLVDARRAKVCWFDRAKIRRDRRVDVPISPWIISRSGSGFVEKQGSLEFSRGEAVPNREAIGIRGGMGRRRSWPGGGGVPGLHSGPGPDFVNVKPGETIVIAGRPANWPDSIYLGCDDECKERMRRQDTLQPTQRLMLLEVPPRACIVQRSGSTILPPGYATRPNDAAGR